MMNRLLIAPWLNNIALYAVNGIIDKILKL